MWDAEQTAKTADDESTTKKILDKLTRLWENKIMSDIQRLAEEFGMNVRSYSGRGMMGKTCLGIVVDDANELFELFYNLGARDREMPSGHVRTDNMGFSTIYYWPYEEYVESEEDFDEDETGDGFDDEDED